MNAGSNITLACTVINSSLGSAPASRLGFYLSSKTYFDGVAVLIGDNYVMPLGANGISSENITVAIPVNTVPGNYNILFRADNANAVSESNETDNVVSIPVSVGAPNRAELTVQNVGIITSATPEYSGDLLEVSATVKNTGILSAFGVNSTLRIQNTATGVYFDVPNISPQSLNISSNSSSLIVFSGTTPDSCNMPLTGTYKAELFVDSQNLITETNETDNLILSNNTTTINRLSFCTNGGGTTSAPPNFDGDGAVDVEEAFAGTNPIVADSTSLIDSNSNSIFASETDKNAKVYGGDPVNIRTGGFEFTQTDYKLPGRGESIVFSRTYNSRLANRSARFGSGWSSDYDQYYYQDPVTKNVQIYKGGAVASYFTTLDGGATFIAPPGTQGKLSLVGQDLVYTEFQGTKFVYSKHLTQNLGILEKIEDTNHNITSLFYKTVRDVPLLERIEDASGRSVILTYGPETDLVLWDKVVSLTDSLGGVDASSVLYSYDSSGHLIEVNQNQSYLGVTENIQRSFTYDSNGLMLTYTDPRGTILYNTYDVDGRVTAQREYSPNLDAAGANRLLYTFNCNGSIPAEATVLGATKCTVLTVNRDNVGDSFQDSTCFNADGLKVYTVKEAGGVESWSYNADGLVTVWHRESPLADVFYEYDSKRRLIKETVGTLLKTETVYSYENNYNRLITETTSVTPAGQVVPSDERSVSFNIDPSSGNTLSFTDSEGALFVYEYDGFGNVIKSTDPKGQVVNYMFDAKGNYAVDNSTQVDIDSATTLSTSSYEYDAFGNVIKYTTPGGRVYTFEFDNLGNLRKETNLYYYNARYYNPATGRFISRDRVLCSEGDTLSKNRYIYVKNNPLKYTDPSGEFFDIVLDIGFIAYDVYALAKDIKNNGGKNWKTNTIALALDVGSAALPFVAGAGSAYRATKIIDKSIDVAKTMKSGQKARYLGEVGEKAAGVSKNVKKTKLLDSKRIPDKINHYKKQMLEVKNTASLAFTKQLRETSNYANSNGYKYILETRFGTKLTKPLKTAIRNGDIVHRTIGYTRGFNIGRDIMTTLITLNPARYLNNAVYSEPLINK